MTSGKRPIPFVKRLLPFAVLGLVVLLIIILTVPAWPFLTCIEPVGQHEPTCPSLIDTAAVLSFFTDWGEALLKILPIFLLSIIIIIIMPRR
jgi:hypothetical protein